MAAQAAASAGGSGGKRTGKLIDWEKRNALATAWQQGGLDSIQSELDYLEKTGYDTDEFMDWLGLYHGASGQFDGGYNGQPSSGKARSDQPHRNSAMLN